MLEQQTPSQEQGQQLLLGNTFLGLANGDVRTDISNQGGRTTAPSAAIDVNTGKVVWKFDTPQPERGGVTMMASGVGFVGGGDGNLRAFDAKTGKVCGRSRPASRSPRARRCTRSTARSTSRSRWAGPRPLPTAAPSRASYRSSTSAGARPNRRARPSRRSTWRAHRPPAPPRRCRRPFPAGCGGVGDDGRRAWGVDREDRASRACADPAAGTPTPRIPRTSRVASSSAGIRLPVLR